MTDDLIDAKAEARQQRERAEAAEKELDERMAIICGVSENYQKANERAEAAEAELADAKTLITDLICQNAGHQNARDEADAKLKCFKEHVALMVAAVKAQTPEAIWARLEAAEAKVRELEEKLDESDMAKDLFLANVAIKKAESRLAALTVLNEKIVVALNVNDTDGAYFTAKEALAAARKAVGGE